MRRHASLFIAVLVGLLMAGCGGSGSGRSEQAADAPAEDGSAAAGGAGDVTFVADDVVYSDAPSTVPAGQVTFELVNEGNVPHDVTLEELDDEVVAHAEGGQTVTGRTELEPGTYTYYCSVPGHRAAGMEGNFTVEG
jgi:plastocyanin